MQRHAFTIVCAALLVGYLPGAASGQTAGPPPAVAPAAPAQAAEPALGRFVNQIDFGFRAGTVSGDAARWQRYRELRDGPTINRFDYRRETDTWWLASSADHVGYRDQRYVLEAARTGRVQARFLWDQIPLFISQDTRTLYSQESPGTLRVADNIQSGIQNGALTIRDVAPTASGVLTRTRRDTAAGEVVYRVTPATDVIMKVTTSKREGVIPYGATFGFNNAVEVPLPIDSRTTNAATGIEWANRSAMVRVAWDGSWYSNNVQTLVWDNPLRLTDSPTAGPAQGRMALWPSNRYHTLSSAASVKLPMQSRLTGSVALGWAQQNEPLVGNTINAALNAAPLPRATADASGRTASTYLALTSRPARALTLTARHRYYEFDNTTPAFHRTGTVSYDTSARVEESEPHFYSLARQTLDVDATTTRGRAAFKVGYGLETGDRTARHWEATTEHAFRTSLDLTSAGPYSVRAQYERSRRGGSGQDLHPLAEAGEQASMAHYDIAERDRQRTSIIAMATPVAQLDLQGSVAFGADDYREGGIGLRDNSHRVYSVGFGFSPRETFSTGLSYSLEHYDALINQRSATALTQEFDATRRWDVDTGDRAHNLLAHIDLPRALFDTDVRLAYDYSQARTTFLYSVPAGSTLAVAEQLPPVRHSEHRAELGFMHHLNTRLALGVDYWYDRYDVEDFALGGEIDQGIAFPILEPGQSATVTTVLLNYVYRPFRGHTTIVRAVYSF
jgi:MtrB/PioB family decaheme-associated outer membrane protein